LLLWAAVTLNFVFSNLYYLLAPWTQNHYTVCDIIYLRWTSVHILLCKLCERASYTYSYDTSRAWTKIIINACCTNIKVENIIWNVFSWICESKSRGRKTFPETITVLGGESIKLNYIFVIKPAVWWNESSRTALLLFHTTKRRRRYYNIL